MEITERVKSLISGYLEENGIELVEIIYRREQGGMVLRLLVDTAAGVTVDECEKLNNFLSEALDKENVIEEHFLLEVASPGLDRALVTDRDFARVMSKELDVRMYEPIDGKRERRGRLIGMDSENIVIESEGISTVIPRKKIAKAKLKIEF
ncbi:MAG: ribosome maturation factor RimP [Candidatus Omnitrophica bacterium]|nr:ribosome maturation factor RimP [Candidatus Omnitrophota bacterium]